MDLVTGAIGQLVPMLVDLLKDEYKLQKGVKVQVRSLTLELESAHAALWLLAKAPPEQLNPQLLLWARDIREASYDMVDILDTFRMRIEGGGTTQMGKLFDLIGKYKARRSIASAISGITMQLKEVTEVRGRYTIESILGNHDATSVTASSTASVYKDVARIVGNNSAMGELLGDDYATLNNAENHLIERQLYRDRRPVEVTLKGMKNKHRNWFGADSNNKGLSVLYIVGFSGIGKTTMATALYQNYGGEFQRRAMVTISQQSDPVIVLTNILYQVRTLGNNGEEGIWSNGSICSRIRLPSRDRKGGAGLHKLEEIKTDLHRHLEKSRYLLLIDDVWSSATWHTIKRCFPDNHKGSRIIVTTRFHAVSMTRSSHHDIVHQAQVLPHYDAKMLFDSTFSEYSGKDIRSSQKEIPDRVWEICGGIPMAIVTMASLMASTHITRDEWVKVFDSQGCRKPEDIMKIINHCYNDLPSDLKTCTLYLSTFPKGRTIGRKRLIRRWIAEGFLNEKKGLMSVEDVADTCFNQLITRKIILPVDHCTNGLVKSCLVHDMVLEYLVSKAAEENFITVVTSHWFMPTHSIKVRRLSVHRSDSKRAKHVDSLNLSHVRSLTVFDSLDKLHFKSFKTGIVQVLDLEGCKRFRESHVKVSDICEMILLKYLCLRRTDVTNLPENIHKLKYLETLDIRETDVQRLPATVGQLQRIKNILGGDKRARKTLILPKDLKGTMRTLCILSGVEIEEGSTSASDLSSFTGLRKLAIYKIHNSEEILRDLLSSIQYLSGYSLQSLKIDDESSEFLKTLDSMTFYPTDLNSLELSGMLLNLPTWIKELNTLVKLTLPATVLRTDNLKILSKLHSLFSLTFSIDEKQDPALGAILQKNKSESGGEIFFPAGEFSKLKLLRIFVPLFPLLNFSRKAAPQLERIELRFKSFEGLRGVDNLLSLNHVLLAVDGELSDPTKSILEDFKRTLDSSNYTVIVNEVLI